MVSYRAQQSAAAAAAATATAAGSGEIACSSGLLICISEYSCHRQLPTSSSEQQQQEQPVGWGAGMILLCFGLLICICDRSSIVSYRAQQSAAAAVGYNSQWGGLQI
jgi:hypothetical protein